MTIESTKITVNITPIGIVNVSVNNVSDIAFRMLMLPDNIRGVPQSKQIVTLEKRQAVVKV